MQNKFLALLLLTSVMCSPAFVRAEDKPATQTPTVVQTVPVKSAPVADKAQKPAPVALPNAAATAKEVSKDKPKEAAKPAPHPLPATSEPKTKPAQDKVPQSAQKPDSPAAPKAAVKTDPAANPQKPADQKASTEKTSAPASIESIQAENKRRLEEELKTTTLTGKNIVNFPNRSSLGSLELTTLPGINEGAFNGPLPMAKSVSNKDMPSEQLLGRITPEVFQEMADIERGNTFLKLQVEKEKIKTDLEKLRATYRQQRMDEITKREDVVRTRIKWWQEQEKIRIEIAKKKLEEEALEREIAEQKANRERLRAEAIARQTAADNKSKGKPVEPQKAEIIIPSLEELYVIESIRGMGTDLSAVIKEKSTGALYTVKKKDTLASGYSIKEIKSDSITGTYGNRVEHLVFQAKSK